MHQVLVQLASADSFLPMRTRWAQTQATGIPLRPKENSLVHSLCSKADGTKVMQVDATYCPSIWVLFGL